jgi:hypothetical protein
VQLTTLTTRWPVILALALLTSAAVLVNMISFVMIGKINVKLPENRRVSYLWWGLRCENISNNFTLATCSWFCSTHV